MGRLDAARNQEVVERLNIERASGVRVYAGTVGRSHLRLNAVERQRVGQAGALDQSAIPAVQQQDFLQLDFLLLDRHHLRDAVALRRNLADAQAGHASNRH